MRKNLIFIISFAEL